MILLHRLVSIARWLFRAKSAERELDAELQSYLDASTADKVRSGIPPAEARRQAIMELGGVEQAKEKVRTFRHGALLSEALRDLRYALRTFANKPGFTLVVVLTLALGIGANTAIFSLMNAVMLKSLPVRDPQNLVEIRMGETRSNFPNPVWEQIRDHRELFEGAIAYARHRFNLSSEGETRFLEGFSVSGSYFAVLGVKPVIGRLFDETDDRRGCAAEGLKAVISYGFWQTHYGGSTDVLGKPMPLDGRTYTVIGVTPPQFFGVRTGQSFSIAIPLCAEGHLDETGRSWLRIMARLNGGSSIQQAERRLRDLQPAIREATMPPVSWDKYLGDPFRLVPASTGSSSLRVQYSRALVVLMAIAGLVLLVTCGNIASLLLARSSARSREIAIRLSIGASRSRLIRQLLIESAVLSLSGSAIGVLVAPAASRILAATLSTNTEPVFLDLSLDWRVLAFAIAAGVLTGLLFGIVPAIRATRSAPAEELRAMPSNLGVTRTQLRAGRWLVSFQMALSLMLIFGAVLFLRSYWLLTTDDHGFKASQVLLIDTGLWGGEFGVSGDVPHSTDNSAPRYLDILDSVRAIPGVESAAYSFTVPVGDASFFTAVRTDDYHPHTDRDSSVNLNVASPHYFETFGTPLLAGRDFDYRDTGSENIIIVNEAFVRKFMAGKNPVGQTVRLSAPKDKWLPVQVVGLVADVKYSSLREDAPPTIYEPVRERISPGWVLSLKSSLPPAAAGRAAVEAIGNINKHIPLTPHTFQSQIDNSLVQERLMAILSAFFGVLALIIAAVGLAGLVSYSVTRRRAEIGIRAALGAQSRSLIYLMMRDVATMAAVGLTSGILCGLAGSRFLTSMLYQIKQDDPAAALIATTTLLLVALLAAYVPARRAATIDPMECLRSD
jgi:predicted permease